MRRLGSPGSCGPPAAAPTPQGARVLPEALAPQGRCHAGVHGTEAKRSLTLPPHALQPVAPPPVQITSREARHVLSAGPSHLSGVAVPAPTRSWSLPKEAKYPLGGHARNRNSGLIIPCEKDKMSIYCSGPIKETFSHKEDILRHPEGIRTP